MYLLPSTGNSVTSLNTKKFKLLIHCKQKNECFTIENV